ncbi:MAG TPA: two-component sensor histidine kinase, partial [Caldimonas sp.]|nr:two-component sensor histidine kinase [Caldimonas sp.]
MKSLYLRIYATVVVVLLLFAFASAWILQRHLEQERSRNESVLNERIGAWADLIEHSLPPADAPADVQVAAMRDWSMRLRVPLALDDASGQRIGASESFLRRSAEGQPARAVPLDDGRTLWTMRPGQRPPGRAGRAGAGRGPGGPVPWPFLPPGVPRSAGLAIILVVLFFAVAAGAYPVV